MAKAVADAAESVNQKHLGVAGDAIGEAGLIARASYNAAYALAFTVVYPFAFVAQWLPQDNPVMHGLRDGAAAVLKRI
ncbi:MAG: hypothetical protein JOY64_27975 [Alphaproteobacteria bacterium]|nr:hypothetical protein [Alphaproteobacteria bacterium]MBV8411498.1 hypothetical protein [Alphaproteobacteria bacterium]